MTTVHLRTANLQVQEQAKAQMQQTVARLTDACWDKCVGTPGGHSMMSIPDGEKLPTW